MPSPRTISQPALACGRALLNTGMAHLLSCLAKARPKRTGFLYTSTLAPGRDATVVANIARDARVRNRSDGISGLLVFDGERFAQFVEGPAPAILSLCSRIRRDIRHVDMTVLWEGTLHGPRRFPNWCLGYLPIEMDGDEQLKILAALRNDAAIQAFLRLTAYLDVDSAFVEPLHSTDGPRRGCPRFPA
jgi:hypothetical protein